MLKKTAVVVVELSLKLAPLFQKVAPAYHFDCMLAILAKDFFQLDLHELFMRTSEFLKFIYLRSLSQTEESFVPVTKPIDEIWHAFIVQTRDYEKFCQMLPGKFFLHHTTVHLEDFGKKHNKTDLVKEMLLWIPIYRQHFGPFTEEVAQYWLMPSFLKEKFGLSLAQINAL